MRDDLRQAMESLDVARRQHRQARAEFQSASEALDAAGVAVRHAEAVYNAALSAFERSVVGHKLGYCGMCDSVGECEDVTHG